MSAGRALTFTLSAAVALGLLAACTAPRGGEDRPTPGGTQPRTLRIAEPTHGLGYLPLYVGIQKGLFQELGLEVEVVTLQGGGAHTNAVLTDQAWAFIGGPEHNAFARAKGAEVRAIVNVVNRGNVYLVARPGLDYTGDLRSMLKGRTIATGAYGGTPNSITRYLLRKSGLDLTDVRLIESADSSAVLAVVKNGQADIAVTSEPILGQGIREGVWSEPFYSVPRELGPYAYSTINVKRAALQDDPSAAERFVRAMYQALQMVKADPAFALEVARKEFPTMDQSVLKSTIERSYADELWEFSGRITPESISIALDVVRAAEVLKDSDRRVTYEQIVDMTFVDRVTGSPAGAMAPLPSR